MPTSMGIRPMMKLMGHKKLVSHSCCSAEADPSGIIFEIRAVSTSGILFCTADCALNPHPKPLNPTNSKK